MTEMKIENERERKRELKERVVKAPASPVKVLQLVSLLALSLYLTMSVLSLCC